MKNNPLLPQWAQAHHLRSAFWGHEPLAHLSRNGGNKVIFFGNSRWTKTWYKRLFSEETVKQMVDLGVNSAWTHFFKGFGLAAEKEEMLQTKEFVQICHEHGIRVSGYTQYRSIYYETFLNEEPSAAHWAQKLRDGSFRMWGGGGAYYRWVPCINSRDFIAYLKKVIDHGITEIGLDGFAFDNNYAEPCYCQTCTKCFRDYLQKHIKTKDRLGFLGFNHVQQPPYLELTGSITDPLYQEWVKFRVTSATAAWSEIYNYIKKINPNLGVDGNPAFPRTNGWANQLSIHPYMFGKYIDVMYAENGNSPRYENTTLVTQMRAFKISEACGYLARSGAWLHENHIVPPSTSDQVKLRIADTAAFGGVQETNWALRTTGGDRMVIDNPKLANALGHYQTFLDKNQHLYENTQTLADVALLHVFESFAWDAHTNNAFMGFEQTLLQNNIPYNILFAENIGRIDDYKVCVLSNQCCLSDELARKLINYVHRGGKLIITGETGEYDECFLRRENNAFQEILDSPAVCHLPQRPEYTETPKSDRWIYTQMIDLPQAHTQIAESVKNLIGHDQLLIQVKSPLYVIVNPRITPDARVVLHVINYNNSAGPAANIDINIRHDLASKKQYQLYVPEETHILKKTISLENPCITLDALNTYAIIELGPDQS